MRLNSFLRDPVSRRRFMQTSGLTVAGGSAAFIAACGGDDGESTTTGGGEMSDIAILNSALALELTAVSAYTQGAALLKGPVLDVGKQFLAQEQEHADGLATAIEDLGGQPVQPKTDEEYAQELGLGKLMDQTDVLNFAVDLENMAIAAYVGAIPMLSSDDLRGTAVQIVTNEAEHVSVLVGALSDNDPAKQVPEAFVTGTQQA